MIGIVAAALLLAQAEPSLRLAYVGRNAVFVDTSSVTRDGPGRTARILRIVPPGEPIAGELYFGGWQKVAVDCKARTFTPLSFTSLRESGVVGPEQPAREVKPYEIADGSTEDGVRLAVCNRRFKSRDVASSVVEAARIGRQRIDDELAAQIRRGGE